MGILSGMLVVFCVKLLTGKKLSLPAPTKNKISTPQTPTDLEQKAAQSSIEKLYDQLQTYKKWMKNIFTKK